MASTPMQPHARQASTLPGDDIIPDFLKSPEDQSETFAVTGETVSDADIASAGPIMDMFGNPDVPDDAVVNVRVEDFISAGMLVPSVDWLRTTIFPAPKGFRCDIARLFGIATRSSRQVNDNKGKPIESIKLEGSFEAQSLITGEVISAPVAYLPRKWAAQVERLLLECADDPNAQIQMDLTIGAEATGASIPHRWTVTTHVQGNLNHAMEALRRRRPVAIGQHARIAHDPGHAD